MLIANAVSALRLLTPPTHKVMTLRNECKHFLIPSSSGVVQHPSLTSDLHFAQAENCGGKELADERKRRHMYSNVCLAKGRRLDDTSSRRGGVPLLCVCSSDTSTASTQKASLKKKSTGLTDERKQNKNYRHSIK